MKFFNDVIQCFANGKYLTSILEGLKLALDSIDAIIDTIRKSASKQDARDALVERFGLSQVQAQAIVDMTLGSLAGLERMKIEEELASKLALIGELEAILADESKLKEIIEKELLEIKEKFADVRRTQLVDAIDNIIAEDLIDRHECVITMSGAGYIKRAPAATYTAQKRGGKGIIGMSRGLREGRYYRKLSQLFAPLYRQGPRLHEEGVYDPRSIQNGKRHQYR